MSYKIYHTEGFILSGRTYGEANRIFKILTPDLGLVNCLAQSVRLEKSKLRFGLSVRRFARISLVRGREFWRLVYAEPDPKLGVGLSAAGVEIFLAKATALLLRFVPGEVEDPRLYQVLKGATEAWTISDQKFQSSLEILMVVRLLSALGYLTGGKELRSFMGTNDWQEKTLICFCPYLPQATRSVNEFLQSSHL